MHTNPIATVAGDGHRTRRNHSPEFKAQVVKACREPGVSNAAVALAHGINANLARRWVVEADRRGDGAAIAPVSTATATFVPVQLPPPAQAPADVRIELRRGPVAISVSWPCSAASECAAWMRELLR